jgi:Asp-tRNA(Asn)/Glu-tRNA(Gln) amidotransferase A subunit family amidase
LGGSLRIPASLCGIVGLRPSPGVVPRGDGLPAFDSLWVDGPMARNVPDLALMLDAMAALTQHDPPVRDCRMREEFVPHCSESCRRRNKGWWSDLCGKSY